MIELKTYETCELKKVLGIGKNTWNNNFDRIIELMDECVNATPFCLNTATLDCQ